MKEIKVFSFAKINLSIDVTGVLENGMHQVDMIMQQLSFHDDVTVRYEEDCGKEKGEIEIVLTTSRHYLPTDEKNIAFKADRLKNHLKRTRSDHQQWLTSATRCEVKESAHLQDILCQMLQMRL